MRVSRTALHGRRGWPALLGLSTALAVVVVGQLPTAGEPLAPVTAAVGALVPSLRPAPAEALAAVPESRPAPAAPSAADAVSSTSAADRLGHRPAAPAAAAPARPPRRAAPAAPAPGLCSGPGWQQRRGQAALSGLKGGAPRTGFRVTFAPARSGYLGLTHLAEQRIEVFVRACGTQSDALLRHVVAHELGHAYDTTHLNAATRRAWLAARGIPAGTEWYGCSGCTDFATPAGDFAEVYAQWARGAATNRSELAGDVPPAQLAQLAVTFFGV